MKYLDYVMKIMEIWMTLDDLEGTGRHIKESGGTKESNKFTNRQIYVIYFKYRHQL